LNANKITKFILFDVDHTLIDSGGAGIVALNVTLEDMTGISNGFKGISVAGKTDMQIVREAMEKFALGPDHGMLPSFLDRYLVHLRDAMTKNNGRIKPGVKALLTRLQNQADFRLGLLTGNIEQGARIKLAPFSLNRFFPVGAYGSDGEDRNHLLPIAVERLAQASGVVVDYLHCIVIGDTPRDVQCAEIHGAASIAVATGPYSIEDLKQTGADLVLADLSETDKIVRWMENR
jgi:phosphoglycolate phosphatase